MLRPKGASAASSRGIARAVSAPPAPTGVSSSVVPARKVLSPRSTDPPVAWVQPHAPSPHKVQQLEQLLPPSDIPEVDKTASASEEAGTSGQSNLGPSLSRGTSQSRRTTTLSSQARRSSRGLGDSAATSPSPSRPSTSAALVQSALNSRGLTRRPGEQYSGADTAELFAMSQDSVSLGELKAQLQATLKREPTLREWAVAAGVEDTRLFAARLRTGQAARLLLLRRNRGLAVKLALRYQRKGLTADDLIAEGCRGLARAVDKFDPSKGVKFSTYASYWVQRALLRALSSQGRVMIMPHYLEDIAKSVLSVKYTLREELGRDPKLSEIAAEAHMPVEKVKALLATVGQLSTLNSKKGSEEEGDGEDELPDTRRSPEEETEHAMLGRELNTMISERLKGRQEQVMKLRMLQGLSQRQTAKVLGVSQQYVGQVEATALERLRSMAPKQVQEHAEGMRELGVDGFRAAPRPGYATKR